MTFHRSAEHWEAELAVSVHWLSWSWPLSCIAVLAIFVYGHQLLGAALCSFGLGITAMSRWASRRRFTRTLCKRLVEALRDHESDS